MDYDNCRWNSRSAFYIVSVFEYAGAFDLENLSQNPLSYFLI